MFNVLHSDDVVISDAQYFVAQLSELDATIPKPTEVKRVNPGDDKAEIADSLRLKPIVPDENESDLVDFACIGDDFFVPRIGNDFGERNAQIHALSVVACPLHRVVHKHLLNAALALSLPLKILSCAPTAGVSVRLGLLSLDMRLPLELLFCLESLLALVHKLADLPVQVIVGSFEVVLVTHSVGLHLCEHPLDFFFDGQRLVDGVTRLADELSHHGVESGPLWRYPELPVALRSPEDRLHVAVRLPIETL